MPGLSGWAQRVVPDPRYYGWRMALVGALCASLSGPGQSFVLSLYLEPLMAATGLDRLGLSLLYSLATLAAALLLPVVGARADRWQGGKFLARALLALAGAMLLLATASGAVVLGISLLLLRMLGQGAIGIGGLALVVRWFERHRGRALAVVTLGYALGEMAFPIALPVLFGTVGWRGSLLLLAGVYAAVFAPFVAWAVREPRTAERRRQEPLRRSDHRPPILSWGVSAAIRTRRFWALAAITAFVPLAITAVLFHQVAILRELGHGPGGVAAAMAGMALGGIAGTLLAGPLVERLPTRIGVAASLALLAAALATAALGPAGPLLPSIYGTMLGLANGTGKLAGSLIWPDYYGAGSVGAIKGVVNLVRNGSTAAGPPLAAAWMAAVGGAPAMLLGLASVAAALAMATPLLRPPHRSTVNRETVAQPRAA